MSKVICDICGTSYADTATQCPICGYVRPANAQSVADGENGQSAGYTYIKGGRFSKGNVKKRNNVDSVAKKVERKQSEDKKPSKIGIIIVIAVLLAGLAVLAVLWLGGVFGGKSSGGENPAPITTENIQPEQYPCTAITLHKTEYKLEQVGDAAQISYRVEPQNCTEDVIFHSDNELVATVDANGNILAVGNGTITVTISCGAVNESCTVIVGDGIIPIPLVLKLDVDAVSFTRPYEEKVIYSGDIPLGEITWVSDNESVALVANGIVTAVDSGETIIRATYKDQTVTCAVVCEIAGIGGNGGVTEDGGDVDDSGPVEKNYKVYTQYGYTKEDVTISVGNKVTFSLKDSSGKKMDVEWEIADSEVCELSGSSIKALKKGTTTISTVCEGKTYSCIIRVKK